MNLNREEASEVVWLESPDWDIVPDTERILSKTRWSYQKTAVFLHKPTGKFYMFNWSAPATENQDQDPFHADYEPVEVEQRQVSVMQWIKKG